MPRDDADRGTLWQSNVIVCGNRVDEHMEFEGGFAIGLHADAGRAKTSIAEADRYGVAGGEEILGDADIKGTAPRPDVALEFPLCFKRGAVRRLRGREAGAGRVGELHRPKVARKAKADLDRARVVNPEPSRRVS